MYSLRSARPEDYERLRQIHHIAFHECVRATWGWDETVQDSMWDEYVNAAVHLQVIELDDEIAGYLDVDRQSDHIFVTNIALDPQFHGRGIGTAVLQDIIAEANQAGFSVQLDVIKANTRARALYERLGFVWIGGNETHDTMERPV